MNLLTTYPPDIEKLLKDLKETQWLTIAYAIVALDPDETPNYEEINEAAMHSFRPGYHQPDGRLVQRASIDRSKMRSWVVTPAEFMGRYYDMQARKLIVEARMLMDSNRRYDYKPGEYDAFFYYDSEPKLESEIQLADVDTRGDKDDPNASAGYAHAFSFPPHHPSPAISGKLIERVTTELFNDFENVEIRRWSNNWSDYFDGGYDWGAYWWTVYDKTKNRVVVVMNVTSD